MKLDQMDNKNLEMQRDYCADQAQKLEAHYADIAEEAKSLVDGFANAASQCDAELAFRNQSK